jgi:hypothetical protein
MSEETTTKQRHSSLGAAAAEEQHGRAEGKHGRAEGKVGVETRADVFPGTNDIWPRPPMELAGFGDINTGAYDFVPGFPGKIVDTGIKDVISLVPETDIPFACAVADGAKNGYCKLATAAGDHVVGIALNEWTASYADPVTGQLVGYRAGQWSCSVLRVGRVWAMAPVAVKRGDPVTVGADGVLGGTGGPSIPGCVWATDAAAEEMAVVQINKNI